MEFGGEHKVIYSKRFPRKSIEEFLAESGNMDIEIPTAPKESFGELIKRIKDTSTFVIKEDRVANQQKFIDLAIELSTVYKIGVKIEDCSYFISVTMYLDCASCVGKLKSIFSDLICMSDRISSFRPNNDSCDFIISLDYHTYDHYVAGKIVDY